MPQKVKYGNTKQPSMPGSIVKRQLALSSQRAKVFQISRRFSTLSNGSQKASNATSVRNSNAMRNINEAMYKVLVTNFNFV